MLNVLIGHHENTITLTMPLESRSVVHRQKSRLHVVVVEEITIDACGNVISVWRPAPALHSSHRP